MGRQTLFLNSSELRIRLEVGINGRGSHGVEGVSWSGIIHHLCTGSHSSTLAWKIPWAEEPGGLQSMGSRRVGHD